MMCASIAAAEDTVPLGTLGTHFIPIPSPSFDTTENDYKIGTHTYQIPRNYIRFAEKDGSHVSMDALLSDMSGLSREKTSCFQNYQTLCSKDVITITLNRGEVNPFVQQIENLRTISRPETKWVCGFEYYEDTSPKIYHSGFRWLSGILATASVESFSGARTRARRLPERAAQRKIPETVIRFTTFSITIRCATGMRYAQKCAASSDPSK
jgi:hypothetical protein